MDSKGIRCPWPCCLHLIHGLRFRSRFGLKCFNGFLFYHVKFHQIHWPKMNWNPGYVRAKDQVIISTGEACFLLSCTSTSMKLLKSERDNRFLFFVDITFPKFFVIGGIYLADHSRSRLLGHHKCKLRVGEIESGHHFGAKGKRVSWLSFWIWYIMFGSAPNMI